MNRPRLVRSLKITWTAMFGLVAVLLCVLWVRSYWRVDSIRFPLSKNSLAECWSIQGTIAVCGGTYQAGFFRGKWLIVSHDTVNRITIADNPKRRQGYHGPLGFGVMNDNIPYGPYWFPIVIFALVAALPWSFAVRRFSLRTLLFAITLIAVGLGLVAWLSH
jgi:hypothetical protein